jgi:purine-binding chemotaxis protein CheW
MDVLVFELGSHRYALRLPQVVEVVRAATITPLPKAPSIVEGAVDFRGTVVPILDVRSRFGLQAKPLSPSDLFILAKAGKRQVAIRVDRATQFVTVAQSDLLPMQHLGRHDYVEGVATLADGLVLIHDLEIGCSRPWLPLGAR